MSVHHGGPSLGRVEISRRWDAQALETGAVSPRGVATAVMTWDDPSWVEAGPSPALAVRIGAALVGLGELAFRFVGPAPAGLRALPGRRGRWGIAATRAPEAAALLFEDGWSAGDQVGIVAATEERCAEILLSTDLGGLALRDGEVLFAAIVDGAGALIAAATERRLDEVIGRLTGALEGGGATASP